MTALAAAMVLMARQDAPNPYLVLTLVVPIAGFWILDGYFLWQERLFRKVYDEIRQQDDTDFEMGVMKHRKTPKCSWIASVFFGHPHHFLPDRDRLRPPTLTLPLKGGGDQCRAL